MIDRTPNHPLALALACALGVGMTACSEAESRDAPARTREVAATPSVPAGTSMTFTLDETVSTADHRKNDRITGTLTADVAGLEGGVTLPAGTKARWVVLESIGPDDERTDVSLIAVQLEAVRNGDQWYPVSGTITDTQIETAAPRQDPSTMRQDRAATVALGAEARTLIRRVRARADQDAPTPDSATEPIADSARTPSAFMGGEEPALIALTSREGPAEIVAGARVTVRLSDALRLTASY